MKIRKLVLFPLAFIALSFIQTVSAQNKFDYSKNGEIHNQVILAWNTYYRDYFASTIKKRFFQDGDVYVLYDVQGGGLQSFVEMTRRCKDTKQIAELVDLLNPVLSELKPISSADNSTGWICSGGSTCTDYGFLGKEVPLCSSQFLGLLGALATNVSENTLPNQRTTAEKTFLTNTFNTMAVHLNRWFTPNYFNRVNERLHMTPADIKDGSSRNFFTDVDLWYLTVLSDLSELQQSGIQPAEDGKNAFKELQNKKDGIKKIFDLFMARTFLTKSSNGVRAEIDKGFWRNYFDNRYAKYTRPESPVSWEKDSNGEWKMITQVKWDSTYIAEDASWDISHSRRLVPALETFVRNRKNIKAIWGYDNPAFDPIALRRAYANQVVEKIWNGDINHPLFSNFWSGDNGWYRVAYAAIQTGRRFAGYPPYGMNTSMPQGGYPVWGTFHPTLRTVFRNIFELSQTDDSKTKSFLSQYYQGLFGNSSNNASKKPSQDLSFLSALVE
jgi:hypothetical protein